MSAGVCVVGYSGGQNANHECVFKMSNRFWGKILAFFRKNRRAKPAVEVFEKSGGLALALGSETLQSLMDTREPTRLMLEYTRAMMGGLLWGEPQRVLHLGLGGGSMLRFLRHYFPAMQHTVVELDADVIEAAHEHFLIPRTADNLRIIQGDGVEFVQSSEAYFDWILVDAFDAWQMVADMAREPFLHDCRQLLNPRGVLTLNFWRSDPHFAQRCRVVSHVFSRRVLKLPATPKGNVAMLAFKDMPLSQFAFADLMARAEDLENYCGVEMMDFVRRLRENNTHCGTHLTFCA